MERREDRARAQASVRERAGEEKPVPEKNVSAQKKQSALRGVGYVAVVAVFSALLLGAQYALWFVKGVEVVTVLLLVFSYRFGVRCGVLSAVAFSLLRCLLFGFFPNVVLLYLIYYPLFAACFGGVGNALRRRADLKTQLLVTALAVCRPFHGALYVARRRGDAPFLRLHEGSGARLLSCLPSDDGDAVCVRSSDGIPALPPADGSSAARQAVKGQNGGKT